MSQTLPNVPPLCQGSMIQRIDPIAHRTVGGSPWGTQAPYQWTSTFCWCQLPRHHASVWKLWRLDLQRNLAFMSEVNISGLSTFNGNVFSDCRLIIVLIITPLAEVQNGKDVDDHAQQHHRPNQCLHMPSRINSHRMTELLHLLKLFQAKYSIDCYALVGRMPTSTVRVGRSVFLCKTNAGFFSLQYTHETVFIYG